MIDKPAHSLAPTIVLKCSRPGGWLCSVGSFNQGDQTMRLKILATVFIGLLCLAAGCASQEGSGKQAYPAPSLWPVIYPSEGLNKFLQDQVIKKELQVTTQWQTVTF
jgi:hypothetical protein